jgi:membrane associated rhomboid family serine protease
MRFNIPPVIRILLITNAVVYLAQLSFPGLTEWGALHHWSSPFFKPHQIITYQFMHDPNSWAHIVFNMLVLWMFGGYMESYWGAKRFINFYLVCGIGAGLIQAAVIPWEIRHSLGDIPPDVSVEQINAAIQPAINSYQLIGASGAIMGIMAAFAYLFPNTEMVIFPIPIPVKAKYVVPVYVLIDLFGGFNRQAGDNVGHFAHLGGALIGLIIVIVMNRTNRRNFY